MTIKIADKYTFHFEATVGDMTFKFNVEGKDEDEAKAALIDMLQKILKELDQ